MQVLNASTLSRSTWFDVALPYAIAETLPDVLEVAGKGWLAVRGRNLGYHSTIYHVRGQLEPGPQQLRFIAPRTVPLRAPTFRASEWVTDELARMVPRCVVVVGGKEVRPDIGKLDKLETCPAMERYEFTARLGETGFLQEMGVDVYSRQDAVEFAGALTWSDPSKPERSGNIEAAWLESSEPFMLDYAQALGFGQPTFDGDLWRVDLAPMLIGNGQMLPLRGAVLCVPNGIPLAVLLSSTASDVQARLQSLTARAQGRVDCLSMQWDGHWLLFGGVPFLPSPFDELELARIHNLSEAALERFGGHVMDYRPLGQARDAGQAGAQEDFGATKGSVLVSSHDVRSLDLFRYCLSEALRPVHYREVDGSPVKAGNHPNWRSWAQGTHQTGEDRLGKNLDSPLYSHGWVGKPNQHESSNLIAAFYALTGDWLASRCMDDEIEHSLARDIVNWPDSPRGQGRSIMSMALRWLLRADERIWKRALELCDAAISKAPGGFNLAMKVRVLSTALDRRALTDPVTGEPVPCWVVWEHALAALGYAGALTAARRRVELKLDAAISPKLEMLTYVTAALVVQHGFWHDGSRWRLAQHVRFVGAGELIPPDLYGVPGWTSEGQMFWSWVIGAAIWLQAELRAGRGRQVLGEDLVDLALRCVGIIEQDRRDHPVRTWNEAEWRAVLPNNAVFA